MSLLTLFEALGNSTPGLFLRHSTLAFALTETVHLLALSLLGGIVAAVGLSSAGIVIRPDWARDLADALRRLFFVALVVVVLSGVGLVAAGPYKYYTNPVFWVKLTLLGVAFIAYLLLDRRLKGASSTGLLFSGIGVVALWLSVAIAGRAIGLI